MLGRGNEDEELSRAVMPPDVYLKEHQIGDVFGHYAADYWRIVVHEHAHELWQTHANIHRSYGTDGEVSKQVNAAIAANFVVPPNPTRDSRIEKQHARLREHVPELFRRRTFAGRLKDCLAWIGAAAVFGFTGWVLMPDTLRNIFGTSKRIS